MMDRQIECHLIILLFVSDVKKSETTRFSCHLKALYISFIFVEHIKIELCFPLVFYFVEKKFFLDDFATVSAATLNGHDEPLVCL